jgi:hypothetical protein
MMMQAILGVAAGLVFLYLLLALMATSINELISGVMSWRAESLKGGLQKLLNDPTGSALYEAVVSHPLIGSAKAGRYGPSYLPAQTFALSLLDRVAPGGPADPNALFDHIKTGIEKFPDPAIKEVLEALVKDAQGDIEKLKQGVAGWFDDSMDRLSGVYKRKTQVVLLSIGLAISVSINADTLMVARILWANGALRGQVSEVAANVGDTQPAADYAELRESLNVLPIGWGEHNGLPKDVIGGFGKVIGLLITTLAISLGAPFWFEVLRRVNAIRSAGPKPQRFGEAK